LYCIAYGASQYNTEFTYFKRVDHNVIHKVAHKMYRLQMVYTCTRGSIM